MRVLVCNAGSTSLKFKLFNMPAEEVLADGKVERVGTDTAIFHFSKPDGFRVFQENLHVPTYTEGIQLFLDRILDKENCVLSDLSASRRFSPKTITVSTS